jgi:hypothetical protein
MSHSNENRRRKVEVEARFAATDFDLDAGRVQLGEPLAPLFVWPPLAPVLAVSEGEEVIRWSEYGFGKPTKNGRDIRAFPPTLLLDFCLLVDADAEGIRSFVESWGAFGAEVRPAPGGGREEPVRVYRDYARHARAAMELAYELSTNSTAYSKYWADLAPAPDAEYVVSTAQPSGDEKVGGTMRARRSLYSLVIRKIWIVATGLQPTIDWQGQFRNVGWHPVVKLAFIPPIPSADSPDPLLEATEKTLEAALRVTLSLRLMAFICSRVQKCKACGWPFIDARKRQYCNKEDRYSCWQARRKRVNINHNKKHPRSRKTAGGN